MYLIILTPVPAPHQVLPLQSRSPVKNEMRFPVGKGEAQAGAAAEWQGPHSDKALPGFPQSLRFWGFLRFQRSLGAGMGHHPDGKR